MPGPFVLPRNSRRAGGVSIASPAHMFSRPLALVLMLGVASHAAAQAKPVPGPAAMDPLARMNEAVDALTRKVWPSVVQILVSGYAPLQDDSPGDAAAAVMAPQQSTG